MKIYLCLNDFFYDYFLVANGKNFDKTDLRRSVYRPVHTSTWEVGGFNS